MSWSQMRVILAPYCTTCHALPVLSCRVLHTLSLTTYDLKENVAFSERKQAIN